MFFVIKIQKDIHFTFKITHSTKHFFLSDIFKYLIAISCLYAAEKVKIWLFNQQRKSMAIKAELEFEENKIMPSVHILWTKFHSVLIISACIF